MVEPKRVPFVGTVSADKWAPCPGLDRLLELWRCFYPGCDRDREGIGGPPGTRLKPFCPEHYAEWARICEADRQGWGIPT